MKKRILIVEDQEMVRNFIGSMFNMMLPELDVTWATSAKEGVGIIAANPAFDLVLTDVDCPTPGNGADVVKAAKQREVTTSVIMMTGGMNEEGIARFAECHGADRGVTKPLDVGTTCTLISELLNPVHSGL